MSRTITRLFDTLEQAERAVLELERAGVPNSDISIVSHQPQAASDRDANVGAALGGGVLAGLGLLAIPGLGPVLAAGWLASAAIGAVVGGAVAAGAVGLVGALTRAGVSREDADIFAEAVRRGGTLVSANVDDDHLAQADAALSQVDSVNVATRGKYYSSTGWNGFDDTAPPYSDEEIERERASV
jgi:hypothetical protein